MLDHPWPGNVRELENVIRNIVVLNDGDQVEAAMLPPQFRKVGDVAGADTDTLVRMRAESAETPRAHDAKSEGAGVIRPLWLEEKAIIERAIALCNGNIPKAAAMLEISASTIYRKRVAWEKTETDLVLADS